MGYNETSMQLLPYDLREECPVIFSHKAALHDDVAGFLRPLMVAGVRSDRLAQIILERHSVEYFKAYNKRENQLAFEIDRARHSIQPTAADSMAEEWGMFSEFADKTKYDGSVPTGQWFADMYVSE